MSTRFPPALALALLLAACTTTSFKSSWKAPDAAPLEFQGKKVAALVIHKNESVRRAAEDALVAEINARGAAGVAAYTLIPAEEGRDTERARARLHQAGVEGAVVMRAVGKQQQATYVPGTWVGPAHYRSFSGYYGPGWGGVYDPGYLRTDTYVSIETLIYSVTKDKLIWAGTSETINPAQVDAFVRELAGAVADELRKQGLVATPTK
jgi:hypothetical protein